MKFSLFSKISRALKSSSKKHASDKPPVTSQSSTKQIFSDVIVATDDASHTSKNPQPKTSEANAAIEARRPSLADSEIAFNKVAINRRHAVYNARGNSVAYGGNVISSERRLPGDGGLPAPRAHRDAHVIAAACDGIALFQGLHPEDRRVLYENMYQLDYGPKEFIVRQGEDGRNFYIIVEGSPIVQIKGDKKGELELEKKLATGDTFGEVALLHSCPRSASVLVGPGEKERVKVWALDRNSFTKLLSNAAFARRERFAQALRNVELLKQLNDYKKLQLADALVPKSFNAGSAIITQDVVEGARFHIIEKGSVLVKVKVGDSTQTVNKLGPGDYFGEVTLREDVPPTATIMAEVQTETLTLDRASFKRLLGSGGVQSLMDGNMKNYVYDKSCDSPKTPGGSLKSASVFRSFTSDFMKLRASPARQESEGGRSKEKKKKNLALNSCKRNDLIFIKELGLGMSGVAYLCKMPNHQGRYVVVKMMSKAKLIRLNQVENVMREKDILIKFDHHFIIDCLGHFQDSCYCYLLMEFMAGGELFSLLNEKQKFSLPLARFYAAEVLLSLEYIHDNGFVYRDLKPENILIEGGGHIRLADMGFCKPLKGGERTYTTCGTADYMAPEVMLSQGHDKAADFWAFGVLIFEMLAGFAPFEGKTDNERLHRILKGLLNYPADFNLHAKDLVSKLCVVDLSNRYGMMAGGLKDIKEHPFFSGLDWFELKQRMIKPPHIPRPIAMSRFEKYQVKMHPPTVADFISKEDNALFAGY